MRIIRLVINESVYADEPVILISPIHHEITNICNCYSLDGALLPKNTLVRRPYICLLTRPYRIVLHFHPQGLFNPFVILARAE